MSAKVLFASPIRNKEYCLEKYLNSILQLDYPKKDISIFFVTNNNSDLTGPILNEFKALHGSKYRKVEVITLDMPEQTQFQHHRWSGERLRNLARLRDMCFDKMTDEEFVFMVDGDVILTPPVLRHLISLKKPVVTELFFSKWVTETIHRDQKPTTTPNAGMVSAVSDGYTPTSGPDFMQKVLKKGTYECDVLFGIWLISKDVVKSGIRFHPIPSDPWDTMEFKVFSRRCREKGIKQYVDSNFPCTHVEIDGSFIDVSERDYSKE